MERNEVKIIHDEIVKAINPIFKKYGLSIMSNRVAFDSSSFNLTIKTIREKIEAKSLGKVDTDTIKFGMADPGTLAFILHEGTYRKIKILQARRAKYCFEFVDEPGKRYLVHFDRVVAEDPSKS
jgi:hypothetical protein